VVPHHRGQREAEYNDWIKISEVIDLFVAKTDIAIGDR
jgi:hypothetical protein